jgi:hypothetical protein
MATKATAGSGTIIKWNGTTVGEVISLSGGRTRNPVEILSVATTNNTKERCPGSINSGRVNIKMFYDGADSSTYNTMNSDYHSGVSRSLTVEANDATTSTWTGNGIIMGLTVAEFGGPDDPNVVTMSVAMSGLFAFAVTGDYGHLGYGDLLYGS